DEFLLFDRVLQNCLELESRGHRRQHLGLETYVAVPPIALGAIHGNVGVIQDLLCRQPGTRGHADTGGDRDRGRPGAFERKWLSQGCQDTLTDQLGGVFGRDTVGDDDELVSAQTPQSVGFSKHLAETYSDGSQEVVTHAVAEVVVDRLELVEVDEEDRSLGTKTPVANQKLLDPVDDEVSVRQAGQDVVTRLEDDLFLAGDERLVHQLALYLKGLSHAHERHVQTSLEHRTCLAQAVLEAQTCGVRTQSC